MLPWKLMFMYIVFLGTAIAVSASSWLMAWIGLEINMLGLLALFMSFKSPRNSEAVLKYFLIQALASAVLICSAFSGSMIFSFISSLEFFSSFILMSLLIKIGAAPFHLWVPQVIEGFSWFNLTLVLTWQKLAPFMLLLFCLEVTQQQGSTFLLLSILASAIVGSLSGLSQTSVRKIIAFSSINHVGWMILAALQGLSTFVLYLVFYSLVLMALIAVLAENNSVSLSQTTMNHSLTSQTALFLGLFSFGGLPPFTGFVPKWVVISQSINHPAVLAVLLMTSLITLFFYLRIAFNSFVLKPKIFSLSSILQKNMLGFSPTLLNLSGILLSPFIFSLI